jgi:general secretion pathway protein G
MTHGNNQQLIKSRGFTLVELLLVLLLVALLASIVTPVVTKGIQQAKESALKDDLQTMRKALDDYYTDKGRYPETLNTLVVKRYLRHIPKDPFTESAESWQLVLDDKGKGIQNIKSGATGKSATKEVYNDW